MARLRVLNVATADGPRDILIFDKVDADRTESIIRNADLLQASGLPPMLAFAFEVDIPEVDAVGPVAVAPRTEHTTVLLAANADEVREWAAHQPRGLSDVLVINATEGVMEGLTIPRRARIVHLPGYEKLPETTRNLVEAALHRAAGKTA